MSWWVGLSREDFQREIAARLEDWQRQRIGLLDTIGVRIMRDEWEPRRPPPHRRDPL